MRTKSIVVGRAMITCVAVHFQECITSAVRMWRLSVWTVLCVHRYVQILQTGGKSSFMSSSWSRNQVLLGIYTLYRYPTLPNLKVRNNHRDWIRLHTDKLHLTASYCISPHRITSPIDQGRSSRVGQDVHYLNQATIFETRKWQWLRGS